MEQHFIIRENWLTQKPHPGAAIFSVALSLILILLCFSFFRGVMNADQWMSATGTQVFGQHQYWRLWTTLFAHGDFGHLIGNLFLFGPLTYLLAAYFNVWFLPILGIAMGGVTNYFVLQTLPPEVTLLGISGMVYWMGAVWFTLSLFIDRRERLRRRLALTLFLTLILFVPETYKPEVSYLSHFVGFLLGILCALPYYFFHRRTYAAFEVRELVIDEPDAFMSFIPTGFEAVEVSSDIKWH